MEIAKLGTPDSQLSNIAISPDGTRVAVERDLDGNTDVWILDSAARTTRSTTAAGFDRFPVWSPDGSKLVLQSATQSGTITLTETAVNGSVAPRVLLEESQIVIPCDWSPDGRFLLYFRTNPGTARTCGAVDGRRRRTARIRADEFRGIVDAVLARRPVGRLSIERNRSLRDRRAGVSRAGAARSRVGGGRRYPRGAPTGESFSMLHRTER